MKDVAEKKLSLSQTLCFFRSVIQSGEPWSATCQEAFDNAVAELRHFAARDREEWIPVSERLPEFNTRVLFTYCDTQCVGSIVEEPDDNDWMEDKVSVSYAQEFFTHWRPLPVAPFTAAQGEKQ